MGSVPIPQGASIGQQKAEPQQGVPIPEGASIGQEAPEGVQYNELGKQVIVPKDGESFSDTLQRAADHGKTVTQQDINEEGATIPGKAATVLAAAPVIGAGGAAALAAPGEMANYALKAIGSLPKEGATTYLEQHGSGLLGLAAQHPEVMKIAAKVGIDAGALLLGAKALHGLGFFGGK